MPHTPASPSPCPTPGPAGVAGGSREVLGAPERCWGRQAPRPRCQRLLLPRLTAQAPHALSARPPLRGTTGPRVASNGERGRGGGEAGPAAEAGAGCPTPAGRGAAAAEPRYLSHAAPPPLRPGPPGSAERPQAAQPTCFPQRMRTARAEVRRCAGIHGRAGGKELTAPRLRQQPGPGTHRTAPGLPVRAVRYAHVLSGSTALLLWLHLPLARMLCGTC